MPDELERNFGEQPLAKLMAECKLKTHDLVAASTKQLTHKMVARAMKGRRLTANVKIKILVAFNKITLGEYGMADLFNYGRNLKDNDAAAQEN